MSPGMPPGCSDRERVNGAITTRCFNFNDPSCTGVNSFGAFFVFIRSSRCAYLVGGSLEMRGPGTNRPRFGLEILLQRLHVHDEAILDVVLHHPGEGRLDLLYGNGLGLGDDAIFRAEAEHLLGARLRRSPIRLATEGEGWGFSGIPTNAMVPPCRARARYASRLCGTAKVLRTKSSWPA